MASLVERIRRRYERFAARLQAALDWLHPIDLANQKLKEWKFLLVLAMAALAVITWLIPATWETPAKNYLVDLKWITGVLVATIASTILFMRNITKGPAPVRGINESFFQKVLRLSQRAHFRPTLAGSEQDIRQIAELEHEAFYVPSRKTLQERYERIAKWLRQMDGLGQFIEVNNKVIGYSVIIPVANDQAETFESGYATEWAFRVKPPDPGQSTLTLYAQATYLKHSYQGRNSTMGLAQAAVLQHLLDLTRRLSMIAQGDDGPDAIQRLLERTRILADEGSLLGGKFMSKLGFVRRKQKTANKRSIWELDLSRPAAPGTNLHQARRLIAERLGLPDRQNIAPPGWKERWENLSSKMFGYTE